MGGESNINIKYFKNKNNDLNKKSSSKHIINNKSNSNLSEIKQSNDKKIIEYSFEKYKDDNLEQNIDDINSIYKKEKQFK